MNEHQFFTELTKLRDASAEIDPRICAILSALRGAMLAESLDLLAAHARAFALSERDRLLSRN